MGSGTASPTGFVLYFLLETHVWGIRWIKICLYLSLERWVRVEEVESTSWVMFHLFFLFSFSIFVCSFVCLFVCLFVSARVRTRGKVLQVPANEELASTFLADSKTGLFRVLCNLLQYLHLQELAHVLECFLWVLLVFLLQSAAISCMSISYACLGVLFVSFAGVLATKCCNIVHVNKLRVFLVMRCIKLWCFVFKNTLLFIYGRKWGESDKIYVKKCSLKHPLLLRKEIPAFYKCFLRISFRIAQAMPYRQIVAWRSLPERFSSDICVF